MNRELPEPKHLHWIGSSRSDLKEFPDEVQDVMGFNLRVVQNGGWPKIATIMQGFNAGVLELVDDYDTDTYRVVCAVKFQKAAYVLHAFKKKSKQGIKTPKHDVEIIKARLKEAISDYARRYQDDKQTKR